MCVKKLFKSNGYTNYDDLFVLLNDSLNGVAWQLKIVDATAI